MSLKSLIYMLGAVNLIFILLLLLLIRIPTSSTRTETRCPYTTLFRSSAAGPRQRSQLDKVRIEHEFPVVEPHLVDHAIGEQPQVLLLLRHQHARLGTVEGEIDMPRRHVVEQRARQLDRKRGV